jgi:hypothetical protein
MATWQGFFKYAHTQDLQDALKDNEWSVEAAAAALNSQNQNGHGSKPKLKSKPKHSKIRPVADSDSSDNEDVQGGGDFQMDEDDDGYRLESGKVYDRFVKHCRFETSGFSISRNRTGRKCAVMHSLHC